MKKMRILLGLTVLLSSVTWSQQDPQFSQYFDNTLFVNPAYAGSKGLLNVTGIHREQWVGFDGRPRSTTLSVHSPLNYESVGLGLTMVADEAGPVRQTMFYGDFSYTLKLNDKGHKLAFGLKAGLNMISTQTADLTTTVASDPKLTQNVRNNINPNFGFGIYYHSPSFFIGASTPKILENTYDGTESENKERRHYFAIAGGVFKLSNYWKLRPTTQLKMTVGAPISIDLSAAGIYREKFWIGAMYRINAAFGVFAQYQITPQFKIGVASDFGAHALRNFNYGTFEMMLSYDFVFKKEGIRSPRYF